jgi:hypothetical protein
MWMLGLTVVMVLLALLAFSYGLRKTAGPSEGQAHKTGRLFALVVILAVLSGVAGFQAGTEHENRVRTQPAEEERTRLEYALFHVRLGGGCQRTFEKPREWEAWVNTPEGARIGHLATDEHMPLPPTPAPAPR